MNLIKAAKTYLDNGISVIPCNDNKACCISSWSQYAVEKMKIEAVDTSFSNAKMIAVICGGVNEGLEVIDVDLKYAISPDDLWNKLLAEIRAVCDATFPIVQTMNGGYHIYFKCISNSRNSKLASRYATEQELEQSPHQRTKCFIETRSNGGYVIAPPSPNYLLKQGSFAHIPILTTEQRDDVIAACKSFNEIEQAPQYSSPEVETRQNYLLSPLDDYNRRDDILQVLTEFGWTIGPKRGDNLMLTRPGKTKGISASFNIVSKLTYIFTSSTEFEPSKAYMPYQILAKLKYENNFKKLAVSLLGNGMGVPLSAITVRNYSAIKKALEIEGESEARNIAANFGYSERIINAAIQKATNNEDLKNDIVFWFKDDKDACKISPVIFRSFLENELHISLFYGAESNGIYRIVTCTDCRLREITNAELKERILVWLNDNTELISKTDCTIAEINGALSNKEMLFSDGQFEWLNRNTKKLLKDTATTAYYYFNNGIVCVDKDGIVLKKYSEALNDTVVWANQVINRDYFFYDSDNHFNFKDFIFRVCGEDNEKFIYLCSLIGYCLHRYKDDAFAKAVMFAEEVEDPKQGGGAGKGLLIKAFQFVIGGMTVDGESFKPDGNFAFQRYNLGCPFICINDAAKNTQWDKWKSIITDGLTVDVKNKDQLYLPYEDSPKILVTTQYGIDTEKMFLVRRFLLFTFEPYFNKNHTPFDEYKEMFFKWSENEKWMQFYNFMFDCVKLYLASGIKELTSKGLSKKTFTLKYGSDLLPFLTSELRECYVMDLYEEFLEINDYSKQDYKRKLFEDGVKLYCATKDYEIIRDANNKNKLKIIVTNE